MSTDEFTLDAIGASCTLPQADRPLRLAEFNDLFTDALRAVHRLSPTSARLKLTGSDGIEARTRDLAAREGQCCSFFDFRIARDDASVILDIGVPPAHIAVLDGLTARATAFIA
jgi:hypothetical protein